MKKMNTVKRIVAFSLAVMMIVLAPLQHTNAYAIDVNDSVVVDTSNKLMGSNQTISTNELRKLYLQSLSNNGGVINSPDAIPGGNAIANLLGNGDYTLTEVDWSKYDIELKTNNTVAEQLALLENKNVTVKDLVPVIIEFDNESVLESDKDAEADAFTALKSKILSIVQESVINRIENQVFGGSELQITSDFTWVMNAVGTMVPIGSIEQIKNISGVRNVYIQRTYEAATADKVSPMTNSDGFMIGREEAWKDFGYTGKGVKIAVIDTGIDDNHQNFAPLDSSKLTAESLTAEGIDAVLAQLNAFKLNPTVTAATLYHSTKIAYAFNYADWNTNIDHENDNQGDHGTHVAGIAAANKVDGSDVVGVAPDAQLIIMKVFGASGQSGSTELLITAIEDALILGADVINMSVGAACGFSSGTDAVNAVYETVSECGVFLSVSAGNSATASDYNDSGTNANTTSNPDNATVSQPSTFINATSVASVNNVAYPDFFIEINGQKIKYIETVYDSTQSVDLIWKELGGQTLQFAMVGNFGQTLEDFVNAGVEGKVAVVSRGSNYFYEKYMLAVEAGAVAVIIYNNTDGEMGANLTSENGTVGDIPCIGVTQATGKLMQEAADAGKNTVYISDTQSSFATPDGWEMSYFSSWGVTPDLQLKPEITAPGGYIYSTTDDGTYGLMSGTSMAAPNVAGMAALVKQYVKEKYPEKTEEELHAFINAVLMSSATPLADPDGLFYSPRKQGSGLANVHNALNTHAYLSVEGVNVPKVNLFDDPDKTGIYEYQFTIHNFGTEDLWYRVDTNAQTEGYFVLDGVEYMSSTPVYLDATIKEYSENIVLKHNIDNDGDVDLVDIIKMLTAKDVATNEMFRYDLNSDKAIDMDDAAMVLGAMVGNTVDGVELDEKVVNVKAGKEAVISVNIKLSDDDKAYMDAHFENGIYVEGYTVLTAYNDGIDLSLPYMGFYGDWTDAPVFDDGYFFDDEQTWVQYATYFWSSYGPYSWVLGYNPYFDGEPFDRDHISVSPNGDGYMDTLEDMYIGLLRNAREFYITYSNAETEEIYAEYFSEYIMKSYYLDIYQQIVPYVAGWDFNSLFNFQDEYGKPLPDGTKVNITMEAVIDYDSESGAEITDTMEYTVIVDTKAPQITDSKLYEENGRQYLELMIQDSCATAVIYILSAQGTLIRSQLPAEKGEPGEAIKNVIDITGCGNNFMIVLGDYAGNEGAYQYATTNNDPEVDASKLYAYRIGDQIIRDDSLFGWLALDKETAELDVMSSEYYMDYALTAAVYIDGYIVAVDANDALLMIKPGYWDERVTITNLGFSVTQMAFDAKNGVLYAFDYDDSKLVKIDLATSEVTAIGEVNDLYGLKAMAADQDGNLYGIDSSGNFMQIDVTTGKVVTKYNEEYGYDEKVVLAKLESGTRRYSLSMTYDAEDKVFYVADQRSVYDYSTRVSTVYGELYTIDPSDSYKVERVGKIGGDSQVIGLLTIDDKGYHFPDSQITGVRVEYDEVTMIKGYSHTFKAVKTPWYVLKGDIEWASSNEEIVTVNEYGYVTAVNEGVATITVTVKVEGATVATESFDVTVKIPDVDFEAYALNGDYSYAWVGFNADDLLNCSMQTVDYGLYTVGEYYDGYVYAFSAYGEFYKISEDRKEVVKLTNPNSEYYFFDMTYDYTNGWMYAVAGDMMTGEGVLLKVDILSGTTEFVCYLRDEYGGIPMTIAATTDGVLYTVSATGFLCEVDLENEELITIGFTGYIPMDASTLAWDHNNGGLYWACPYEGLIYIDEETGLTTNLGFVNGQYGWLAAMYTIIDEENVPEREYVPVEEIIAINETILMIEGMEANLPIMVLPFNATNRTVSCVIEDEEIAEFVGGRVKALKAGTTYMTVTVDGQTAELAVVVRPSAGAMRGFILMDVASYGGYFWGEIEDNNLAEGMALAMNWDYDFNAAENIHGEIYSYGMNMESYNVEFVKQTIDEEMGECINEVIGSFNYMEFPDVRDMAFDYSTNALYVVAGVRNSDANTKLYNVDMSTGELYAIGEMDDVYVAMTCTTEGQLYAVTQEGIFCAIDKETGESEALFDTGYLGNMYQSMTYDHNTGNIYWAQVFYDMLEGKMDFNLVLIDLATESAAAIGQIGQQGCQVIGLYVPIKEETKLPNVEIELKKVLLDKASIMLQVGEETKLSAAACPIQMGGEYEYSFESSNPEVATVDEQGNIVAVASGSAIITVTCNEVTATCKVNVLGDAYQLQAFNTTGIGIAGILETEEYATTITFDNEEFVLASADYSATDNCYYAVGEDGYLWKITTDGQVTKIGEKSIIEQYEGYDDFYVEEDYDWMKPRVKDIVVSSFDHNVYALAQGYVLDETGDYLDYYTYIFQIDTATGEPTVVAYFFGNDVAEFDFTSERDIIYFDNSMNYICSVNLDSVDEEWGGCKVVSLAWTQEVMCPDTDFCFGMEYSKELNTVFFVTSDAYNNWDPETYEGLMALYAMDMNTKFVTKLYDTPIHTYELRDICIFFVDDEE